MKVVSIKAKIKNKIDILKTLASTNTEFGDTFFEHDRIFLPRGYEQNKNLPKLIIRTSVDPLTSESLYTLVFKRHVEDQDTEIVHSTDIADYTQTVYILHQLGYELKSEIAKNRQEIIMQDGIILLIDKIDALGTFIKVEKAVDPGQSPLTVREDLIRVLDKLNIQEDALIEDTYANLLDKKSENN